MFVNTIVLAHALKQFLAGKDNDLKRLRAKVIVGNSEYSRSRQMCILDDFKSGKINVLISTSVCEEGVDVTGCDRVILYDGVQSGRQLTQAKGRARDRNSKCFVFEVEDSNKLEKSIREAELAQRAKQTASAAVLEVK